MKKNIYIAIFAGLTLSFASCNKFDYEDPTFNKSVYESDREATEANISIKEIKAKYKTAITNNSTSNKITTDEIFDGYVVANDISGNLYQTLVVCKDKSAINVAINDYSLWHTYPVGTHVTVNLNGLYVGGYGTMPKIGTPYYTSSGNLRLGAMLKSIGATNVKVIGFNTAAADVNPLVIDESWLKSANKDEWAPMLVRINNAEIRGLVVDGYRRPMFANSADEDAGYGVNDTLMVGNTPVILRTSTSSTIAYETIPREKVDVIALLTRYNKEWQLQLRDISDVITKK